MDSSLKDAIYENDIELIKELIDEGVDLNKVDKYGATPLFVAAYNGKLDVVKLLLDKGVDVNKADEYGETPLYAAAGKGNTGIINLLLDKGAEVNLANTYGVTPLFVAAYNYKLDVVHLLLDRGAEINTGEMPSCVAAGDRHAEIVDLLRTARDHAKKTEPETDKINIMVNKIDSLFDKIERLEKIIKGKKNG